MDIIIICMAGMSVCCTVQEIIDFNRIYPVHYGKNHVELKGIVMREQDMKVGRFRSIHKIGGEVIVCYNLPKMKMLRL